MTMMMMMMMMMMMILKILIYNFIPYPIITGLKKSNKLYEEKLVKKIFVGILMTMIYVIHK